jgi:periplasmic protein TonB
MMKTVSAPLLRSRAPADASWLCSAWAALVLTLSGCAMDGAGSQVASRTEPQAEPRSQSPREGSNALDPTQLDARRLEIARLRAQLERNLAEQQPRRSFIGARPAELRFARYGEEFTARIEMIGNLNYPEEARRQRLYGTLVLTVAVLPDGSVDAIRLNRSSGFPQLDEAAIRIVRMAAPFAPFPPDIAKDTDILEITRTWRFTSSEKLQGQ